MSRISIVVLFSLSVAAAVAEDYEAAAARLRLQAAALPAQLTRQLSTAMTKLQSDYDAFQDTQIKQTRGDVLAAVEKAVAAYNKTVAANQAINRPAILGTRQAKQALLIKWEEELIELEFNMRFPIKTSFRNVSANPSVQDAAVVVAVNLRNELVRLQETLNTFLTVEVANQVSAFAAQAQSELFHVAVSAEGIN
ncbi:uncharacterized protein LOC113209939 isoform X2 [Frankliniella occidentalis]|uniref:Uncharacterized protein LOC113209939 isoform X2 n=1 Tax=Frankliniella occidentalis TaxID=133901 RepID=A0A9C6XU86_FRAOC|nr:uncharacterized protein LOC113209939 isoform X2 [Frankliniella occidentalis]